MNAGELALLIDGVKHVTFLTRFRLSAGKLAREALDGHPDAVVLDGGVRQLLALDLVSTETVILSGLPPEEQMPILLRWLEKFFGEPEHKAISLVEDSAAAKRLGGLVVNFAPPRTVVPECRDLVAGRPHLEDEVLGDEDVSDLCSRWVSGELPEKDFLGQWLARTRYPLEVADLVHERVR